MEKTKMEPTDWKYPAANPYDSGNLMVSDKPKHLMHWEEYGNPRGEPVFFIHGGPGGSCSPEFARAFNPDRYRIILFDQRGCGESKPHTADNLSGAMDGNITKNLIADIEKLRANRGITGKAHIFGGSWGSTLALAYAQAHPEHVQNLILRGIFLCDKNDLGYFYQGNAATYPRGEQPGAYEAYSGKGEFTIPQHLRDPQMAAAYEQAWHEYVSVIPAAERGDMIGAYHRRLNNPQFAGAERLLAALAWTKWEGVTSNLKHDVSDLGKFEDPKFAVAFATIENEYFYRALNGKDEVLSALTRDENIAKLAHIPTYIVQGAHDQVCVPSSAHTLKAKLEAAGVPLAYQETVAGHSFSEKETNRALTEIMAGLPTMRQLPEPKSPMDHATRTGNSGISK